MKRFLLCAPLCLCLLLAGCSAASGGDLTIRVADLSGEVSFIDYSAGGTAMQVIARLDGDGNPKLSYNTCQSCQGSPYAYFEVVSGALVCRNCGNRFGYDTIGEKRSGGCMPIAVEGYRVEEGQVTVPAEALESMKSAFANWKKGL